MRPKVRHLSEVPDGRDATTHVETMGDILDESRVVDHHCVVVGVDPRDFGGEAKVLDIGHGGEGEAGGAIEGEPLEVAAADKGGMVWKHARKARSGPGF